MIERGRPEKLTDDLRRFVSMIKDKHPKRTAKQIQQDIRLYLLNDEEVKQEFGNSRSYPEKSLKNFNEFIDEEKLPGYSRISKYLTELNNNQTGIQPSPPWNTGKLDAERIEPEVIPMLIGLQNHRKSCYSKPMTICEAKWFNRLSGFRKTFTDLIGMGIPINLRDTFLSLVIATWAQMYAYHEKIDTIAGIKEPDYSDLDNKINEFIAGNFQAISQYDNKWVNVAMAPVFNKRIPAKDFLAEAASRYLKFGFFDTIRAAESAILGHSLGNPDMPENSLEVYGFVLGILLTEKDWGKALKEINYQQKLNFLRFARQWCMANPDLEFTTYYSNSDMKKKIDSAMSNILDNVKGKVPNERSDS